VLYGDIKGRERIWLRLQNNTQARPSLTCFFSNIIYSLRIRSYFRTLSKWHDLEVSTFIIPRIVSVSKAFIDFYLWSRDNMSA
jgi:hypothetical protein